MFIKLDNYNHFEGCFTSIEAAVNYFTGYYPKYQTKVSTRKDAQTNEIFVSILYYNDNDQFYEDHTFVEAKVLA